MQIFLNDRLPISKIKEKINDSGHLKIQGKPARVGIQEYHDAEYGTLRILRTEDEVKKSLNTFDMLPVTLDHPKGQSMVDTSNSSDLIKGFAAYPVFEDGFILQDYLITHQDAIIAASTTHQELSVGYFTNIELESGVWTDTFGVQGEKGKVYDYDAVQTEITANHVALVPKGRAGKNARLLFDNINRSTKNKHMVTIVYKDSAYAIGDGTDSEKVKQLFQSLVTNTEELLAEKAQNIKEIQALKESNTSLNEQITVLDTKNGEDTGTIEQLKTKIKNLEQQNNAQEIADRIAIWSEVKDSVPKESIDFSLGIGEIRKLYLSTKYPKLQLQDASDDYLAGLWSCLSPSKVANTELNSFKETLEVSLNDSSKVTKNSIESARAKAIERKTFKRN